VTVTLNSAETPTVTTNAEQGNYELSCTITNETTGEAIALQFVLNLNSYLEIDTANRTVTWLADDSRQLQALTKTGTRMTPLSKRHWLRLLPGSNTLRFDEVGVAGLTLTTAFRERYY
jgi:phage-related protein